MAQSRPFDGPRGNRPTIGAIRHDADGMSAGDLHSLASWWRTAPERLAVLTVDVARAHCWINLVLAGKVPLDEGICSALAELRRAERDILSYGEPPPVAA